jgi:hypothetical protein
MVDLIRMDVLSLIIFISGALEIVIVMVVSAIHTKRLRDNSAGFGRISLSLKPFILIQVVALVVAGFVAYALYWTPVRPFSMAVFVTGPVWGMLGAYFVYRARRLPFVISIPALLGVGLSIGNQLAIVQRAIEVVH